MTSYPAVLLPDEFVRIVSRHQPDGEHLHPPQHRRVWRPDGATWLRALPGLVEQALGRWHLEVEESLPLRWGFTALVIPVRRPEGDPGVLKVGWPHPEADVEHLVLRAWNGHGAVRLLAAEPTDTTYLLERLEAERDLRTTSVQESSEVLGQLLRTLDRPAPPWAHSLTEEWQVLADETAAAIADPTAAHRFPRRMLQHAQALARDTLAETGSDRRLVHTDLHHGNVLWRPDPGEWVAIDPKVVAGDPHWAVAPALWNRWEDALAAHDLGTHLLFRLDLICEGAGLDRDRARDMTILRLTQKALWAIRRGGVESGDDLTTAIAVIKAMQRG
ncbi:MAG: aminoglycoside phosphotransferase family protein [Ornithinimicrobium sp.]|uniref:aminoglycoside phosphotransferase family protein n=1 Tax=Ornithinimicrobium sp. TaxID=1977084 RepID=UPI0026DFFCF7|nr:aminoglycoside phosphotransferase family protein [Ornithinimicrobium sp.]MDO5739344.1 aminoglycoside phosphotransferase family protein [Ornithinimicrobium sp.]